MRILTWLLFLLTLLVFGSVFITPGDFPYVGLLPFFVPVFWLINLFLLIILTLSWRKLAFLPLLALLIGYRFAQITFQLNPRTDNPEGLKVLTYNAHLFDYKRRMGGEFDPNVFTWLQDHPADVKVFQEFFQDQTTPSRNALKLLGEDKDMESVYQIVEGNSNKRSHGLAIFSRFPIIHEGVVFDTKSTNGAIFADIVYESDTVRIYNCHLESMRIESEALDNLDGVKEKYRQTLGKLHRGSLARSKQLKVLEEHVANSPHPVIVMGDFNEIPYSNTYFRMSKLLTNAFETAGRGFGFTYNKILFFLRIDHIFSSSSLKAIEFKTHREVDYSDHYPVTATFRWDKNPEKQE